jgi:HEAT repeat protein
MRKEPFELLSDAELDKVLADLASKNGSTQRAAAERLSKAFPVVHRRAEVAHALESLTTDWQFFVRQSVAHALTVWAVPENVPALIKMLDDTLPGIRTEAMDALATLKDERGAQAVAQKLPMSPDRGHATKALEAMGPVAQKAVLPFLTDRDAQVRLEACHILKTIGTQESVAGLQTAAQDKDRRVVQAAQEAIRAVAGRP